MGCLRRTLNLSREIPPVTIGSKSIRLLHYFIIRPGLANVRAVPGPWGLNRLVQ
jgi:hypothetical protein